MMQETGPSQESAKELEATLFNLQESLGGVTGLMDKPLVKIEQGIVAMDQGFRSIVNSMGAGENMSEAIRKNLAGATIETIKMGGDSKSALNVQLDTLKVMGKNVTLSQDLTTELFAASQVSGKSIEDLENGFLNAGMSLKDISKQMLVVRDVANNLGVNAKLVSESVVKNLDKLNSYGFQGGVEGLARMAAKATALRVDMQSTFNVADKLMSPEGAIEMSAALQRLGATSTDLLDPLKLMDLAQNNVPELQKQLGDMFKQYTYFDEKTKTFQIMPGARRQLKEIAGELGMGIEEVQRMALGTADLDKKLSEISFSGFEVSEDTKEMVANMATMTDSGEYKIQTEEIGADGKPVSKTIQEVMEQFKGDEAGLKEYLTGLDKSKQPKTIEEIAQEQLDVLTGIRKASEALVASPGLAAGASKVGPQVLQSAKALAEKINEPLTEKLGPDNQDLIKTFDNTAVKLEEAFRKLTKGDPDEVKQGGKDVLAAFGELSKGMGKQIAGGVGDSLTGFSELFGIDIEKYKNQINESFLTAKEKAEAEAAKLKDKVNEKTEKDKTIFPDENKLIFPDSVNTQEIKTSSITVEKPETEEETKLIFPDNVESKEIKTGKIIVEEGINLTVPTPTPTITPTNVTPEVGTKPTGEVKGETIINPTEDPQLQATFKQLQELVAKGLVGEPIASTGNEVLFNQELPELTGELPEIKEVKTTEPETGFLEKFNNFVQELKIQPVEAAPTEEVTTPKKTDTGFRFFDQSTFKTEEPKSDIVKGFEDSAKKMADLKIEGLGEKPKIDLLGKTKTEEPTVTSEFVKSITPETEKTEGPKTDLLKGFESSLQKISEFKFPEIGLLGKPKIEEPKTDLVKGFEDSAKKMADLKIGEIEEKPKIELGKPKTEETKTDLLQGFESSLQKMSELKIGGLEKEPKIELGKSEETTEKKLFDFKPSILGKFISEGKVETEEKPEEENKGRFSKIKDAFVKSFIEPKEEEQTFVLPEEEYTPNEIGTEEGIGNLDKTATELGIKQEELTNIALQQDQPETTEPITELKLDTSEVETLNVKNLNIGDSLTELLTAGKKTEGEETNFDKIQKLIQEGLVGEATAGPGVLFKPTKEEESLKAEQAMDQAGPAVPTPTATPIETPTIDAQAGLPELTEELPQTLPTGKTRGIFKKTEQTEEPSAYEGYKKLLEEISGAEIVGQGKDAFFLTDEMKAQAKKDSEFIGPEKGAPKKIESTRSITPPTKEELAEIEKELELESYYKKFDEINDEIGNFKKEKIGVEGKGTMNEEDLGILEHMGKRYDEYEKKIMALESGEVDSFIKKIEPIGLDVKPKLAPMKPTLASLPIPEKEEKQPLGERIKEGIGGLKEKFKGKQEEEKPIAAVPETPKTFVARDAEGNIVGESIDGETARKMAGGKAITVEEETQTVTPTVPETPAVGVEKAAAEAEEKIPFKEKLKDRFKKLIEEKPDESEAKITIEEPTKIEPIVSETQSIEEPKTLRERIEEGADKLSGGIEKFAGKIGEKFEGGNLKSKIDEIRGKIKPQEEESKIEPVKQDMFPLSKGFDGPFYEMKDGKLQMRDPYEMLDEKEKKEKESLKIEPIPTEPILSDEDKKWQEERRKKMEEEDRIISSLQTDKYGKPVTVDKIEPTVPETPSVGIENIKLSDIYGDEDESIVDPVSEFAEDGTIKPFSGKPEEIKEPEETEIQKTIREAREKQLAFLEELRLKEQTPETPARGIEKLAGMGQKIGGLFGFGKEEPTITTPEVPYEEPEETFEGYATLPEETQITPTETIEGGFETETPELIQDGIPEDLSQIALPNPIGAAPQGGYGETEVETKPGETVEKKMTVEGGSPIEVTVIHKFVNLPTTIDTNTLSNVLKSDNNIQQAIAKAVKDAALGLTS